MKRECQGKKVVKFVVSFPDKKELNKNNDYGYYVSKASNQFTEKNGNVLFNIMNTFRVTRVDGSEVEL